MLKNAHFFLRVARPNTQKKKSGEKKSANLCSFFFSKVLTLHHIETRAKIPVQKAFGGGPSKPPLCKLRHTAAC